MLLKMASKVELFENTAILQLCKQAETEHFENDSFETRWQSPVVKKVAGLAP